MLSFVTIFPTALLTCQDNNDHKLGNHPEVSRHRHNLNGPHEERHYEENQQQVRSQECNDQQCEDDVNAADHSKRNECNAFNCSYAEEQAKTEVDHDKYIDVEHQWQESLRLTDNGADAFRSKFGRGNPSLCRERSLLDCAAPSSECVDDSML
jgi:hypothetical protein